MCHFKNNNSETTQQETEEEGGKERTKEIKIRNEVREKRKKKKG